MDGGIGDLLNVFLNNPEMMKKASDLLSRLSADNNASVPEENNQTAVPAMAQATPPPSDPQQNAGTARNDVPQTETPSPEQNSIGNMSGDQLAAMVSSVMSALGMNAGGQTAAPQSDPPQDVPPSAEPHAAQETTVSPPQNGNGATPASANFDIEKALGVLKNVSAETSPQKDNRIQLLLSLKPFMKDGRKQKIDMAVKYLNAAKVFNMFGKNGFI